MFTDPERLGEMIGLTKPALAPIISDSIRDRAAELVSAGIPAAFSERLLAFLLRELGEWFVEHVVANVGQIFPLLCSRLADVVRDAHNSILATSPERNAWVTALATFDWTIEAGSDLILPDAVALTCEDEGPLMPLLFTKAADVRTVVMPVSSNRILVGRIAGSTPIELGAFNTQAAAGCESFFVSAKPFKEGKLEALIGSAPANAIEEATTAAIRAAEQTRSAAGIIKTSVEPLQFAQRNFKFSVQLADFGDDILAREFADVLHGVIGTIACSLPLHELDGFTIAVDYHRALATLDRGDSDLPRVTSCALSYGVGVVKPVTVIRDGARKVHLVVAAGLAAMWLSSDAKERATGLHMIVDALAGVAHATQYAIALETGFRPDTTGREFHLAVATAPAGYWSAREAAFIEPDQGRVYADLVIDSLDFAEQEIADERARIPQSGDTSNTTIRALECVSAVINHAADWLGHRDGLTDGHSFEGSDLPERLRVRGLDRWIELFGRDLAACYGPDGTLFVEVATSLSSHVERLLWCFGIYCWPENDDVRCLVTDRPFILPELP